MLLLEKNKFHISNTHFKGETKTYHVCMGKPHFSGSVKQEKATINVALLFSSIRYIDASDTSLRTTLQEHIDVVKENTRDIIYQDQDRISNLDTTQNSSSSSDAPIQPRPPIMTNISDIIDNAIALNLRIFPRPGFPWLYCNRT